MGAWRKHPDGNTVTPVECGAGKRYQMLAIKHDFDKRKLFVLKGDSLWKRLQKFIVLEVVE